MFTASNPCRYLKFSKELLIFLDLKWLKIMKIPVVIVLPRIAARKLLPAMLRVSGKTKQKEMMPRIDVKN